MEGSKTKKVKKKKLRIKILLLLLLALYIIGHLIYITLQMPIRNIYITGTTHLRDVDIIEAARIQNYPTIFRTRNNLLMRRIRALDLVNDVRIRKNMRGQITIIIEEHKILFYNRNTNRFVLDNHHEIESNDIQGFPILINFVPDVIYYNFLNAFANIQPDLILLISEIEYAPLRNEAGTIVAENRFLFRMNDGNHVFIDIPNILRFNSYREIFITLNDQKGIINLDSDTDSVFFQRFDAQTGPSSVEDNDEA